MLTPPFTIEKELPPGGLGKVYVLRDANRIRFVGKFPKDHLIESQQLIQDEERRFRRHQGKHVVQYFGRIRLSDGREGFAMELMHGSLANLVASRRALPPAEAVEYLAHAVAGLCEVHASAEGAYHGDVKLANILYKDGLAKLADFGLARGGAGQTQMLGPHTGGTVGYFPPEGYASPAGDVYSAGMVLWAMLMGREPGRDGPRVRPALTGALGALLDAMLVVDPLQRPTMPRVLELIAAARAQLGVGGDDDWFGDLLKFGLGLAAAAGLALVIGKAVSSVLGD